MVVIVVEVKRSQSAAKSLRVFDPIRQSSRDKTNELFDGNNYIIPSSIEDDHKRYM